jgi:hypothetical protein
MRRSSFDPLEILERVRASTGGAVELPPQEEQPRRPWQPPSQLPPEQQRQQQQQWQTQQRPRAPYGALALSPLASPLRHAVDELPAGVGSIPVGPATLHSIAELQMELAQCHARLASQQVALAHADEARAELETTIESLQAELMAERSRRRMERHAMQVDHDVLMRKLRDSMQVMDLQPESGAATSSGRGEMTSRASLGRAGGSGSRGRLPSPTAREPSTGSAIPGPRAGGSSAASAGSYLRPEVELEDAFFEQVASVSAQHREEQGLIRRNGRGSPATSDSRKEHSGRHNAAQQLQSQQQQQQPQQQQQQQRATRSPRPWIVAGPTSDVFRESPSPFRPENSHARRQRSERESLHEHARERSRERSRKESGSRSRSRSRSRSLDSSEQPPRQSSAQRRVSAANSMASFASASGLQSGLQAANHQAANLANGSAAADAAREGRLRIPSAVRQANRKLPAEKKPHLQVDLD